MSIKKSNPREARGIKITSAQIAKLAGVSRSTVSRVINGYENVPAKTRDHVMNIVRQNNYYPDLSGQMLAGKKSNTLGFFWIKNSAESIALDDLSSSYMAHVIEAAARHGYTMLTCILDDLKDPKNRDWVNKIYVQGSIDAGIFIGANNDEPLIENLLVQDYIVGLFDHYQSGNTYKSRISVNYEEEAGSKIIDYLYGLGHTKIALIYGSDHRYSSLKRKEGFINGMSKHGLQIRGEWLCYGGIDKEGGYMAAKNLIKNTKELPTAICANNDAVAFGVYKALKEANIKIPDQISVTGIDGHTHQVEPPLTTYAFDYSEVFTSLVTRTIYAVEGKEDNLDTEFIKGYLVERGSVLNIKNKEQKQ